MHESRVKQHQVRDEQDRDQNRRNDEVDLTSEHWSYDSKEDDANHLKQVQREQKFEAESEPLSDIDQIVVFFTVVGIAGCPSRSRLDDGIVVRLGEAVFWVGILMQGEKAENGDKHHVVKEVPQELLHRHGRPARLNRLSHFLRVSSRFSSI